MKRKIVTITAFLLILAGGFTSCKKEINDKLIGNWVNENRDTLSFLTASVVHFNPFYLNMANPLTQRVCYEYHIKEDRIVFCSHDHKYSPFPMESFCGSCHFKYSKKQIEVGELIYKRIK